ncbi:lipase family protein [bacterium]|nr:lipase family protein [bacterium]
MKSIMANSALELNSVNSLLDKNVPSYRQAYSDRTAWLMACMSELAYIRFNPIFSSKGQKDYFLDNVTALIDENKKSSLLKMIDMLGYDHLEEKKRLETELEILRIKLIETFDSQGTQAILVSNEKFIILAFRGTETTSIKDIKADIKAKTTQYETGGKIHTGFYEAFDQVYADIQKKINDDKYQRLPLFITGHSLGGALATIAAKKLTHRAGIAACYTFGSPRVGDKEWVANIKTPIYRLVNAADCVTMLPPVAEIVSLLGWIFKIVPKFGDSIQKYMLSKLGGYLHAGNMRFLTNCRKGQYANVMLLYSVSIIFRIKGFIIKKLPWKTFLADHAICVYRKKLSVIAHNRNAHQ